MEREKSDVVSMQNLWPEQQTRLFEKIHMLLKGIADSEEEEMKIKKIPVDAK